MDSVSNIIGMAGQTILLGVFVVAMNASLKLFGLSKTKKDILVYLSCMLICAILAAFYQDFYTLFATMSFIFLGFLALTLLNFFVWNGTFIDKQGQSTAPRILILMVDFILWLVLFGLISKFVFNQDITTFLAASGFFAIIIGYAAQGSLGDIFSGIAVCLAQNIKKGHTVKISEHVGTVIDLDWRSLKLKNSNGNIIIIPHRQLAGTIVCNFSTGDKEIIEPLTITIPATYPPPIILTILQSAALDSIIHQDAEMSKNLVYLNDIASSPKGSLYSYTIKIPREKEDFIAVKSRFLKILYSKLCKNSALFDNIPENDYNNYKPHSFDLEKKIAIIKSNPILSMLSESETLLIAENLTVESFIKDERISIQGSHSNLLRIVADGEISAYQTKDGVFQKTRTLCKSDIFGLQSFLLGKEVRITTRSLSDTAQIFSISREFFSEIINNNHALVSAFTDLLEKRISENDSLFIGMKAHQLQDLSTKDILKSKIRELFA